MASDAEVRPPSWGVVALVVVLAVWLLFASVLAAAASAPRALAPRRRRARYVGAHSKGRVLDGTEAGS